MEEMIEIYLREIPANRNTINKEAIMTIFSERQQQQESGENLLEKALRRLSINCFLLNREAPIRKDSSR